MRYFRVFNHRYLNRCFVWALTVGSMRASSNCNTEPERQILKQYLSLTSETPMSAFGRCRLNLSAGHVVGIVDQFESKQPSMFYRNWFSN